MVGEISDWDLCNVRFDWEFREGVWIKIVLEGLESFFDEFLLFDFVC
jgi:hypothetical protein